MHLRTFREDPHRALNGWLELLSHTCSRQARQPFNKQLSDGGTGFYLQLVKYQLSSSVPPSLLYMLSAPIFRLLFLPAQHSLIIALSQPQPHRPLQHAKRNSRLAMDAQNPSQPSSTPRATALSFICAVSSLRSFVSFLNVAFTFTFDSFTSALRNSARGITALTDYLSRALPHSSSGYARALVFHLSPLKIVALVFPFRTGNFLSFLYISYLLSKGDVISVLVSYSAPDHAPIFEPPARPLVTKTTAALIVLTGTATTTCALLSEGIRGGLDDFRTLYRSATLLSLVVGFLFPITLICVREKEKPSRLVQWVGATSILGDIITCLYVIKIAHQSLNFNSSFRHLLLSQIPQIA